MKDEQRGAGFQWDEGNRQKNWIRHRVSTGECEEVFFHRPFVVGEDAEHSDAERRYFALGRTAAGRQLFVVYTYRGELVRVISARDMTPQERRAYADAQRQALAEDPEL